MQCSARERKEGGVEWCCVVLCLVGLNVRGAIAPCLWAVGPLRRPLLPPSLTLDFPGIFFDFPAFPGIDQYRSLAPAKQRDQCFMRLFRQLSYFHRTRNFLIIKKLLLLNVWMNYLFTTYATLGRKKLLKNRFFFYKKKEKSYKSFNNFIFFSLKWNQ